MLELVVPSDINEGWDEIKGEFIYEELKKKNSYSRQLSKNGIYN